MVLMGDGGRESASIEAYGVDGQMRQWIGVHQSLWCLWTRVAVDCRPSKPMVLMDECSSVLIIIIIFLYEADPKPKGHRAYTGLAATRARGQCTGLQASSTRMCTHAS